MPFGMVNSAATLVRGLQKSLANLGNVVNYMDDISVHSKDWDDHAQTVKELLSRLTARPTKCVIGSQALDFVSHHIQRGEICPKETLIQRIRNAQVPTAKKEM